MLFVGIDALPGKGYGVEQVLEGVLDATFIYPTGGDKVMQVAMDIWRSVRMNGILSYQQPLLINECPCHAVADRPHCRTGRKDRTAE